MLQYLKETECYTYTENGALTLKSSGSACLDLFGTIGALRHAEEADMIQRFSAAYQENPELAVKTLFFARDVRGGLGERKVFRVLLKWLADTHPESVLRNLNLIAEYGRYDDLLCLWNTGCRNKMVELIRKQLNADIKAMSENKQISLLAKWLPSVNASNAETIYLGKRIAGALGMKEAEYRKTLSALRRYLKIIENNLREQETAVENHITQSERPETLYIISDMEFDACVSHTTFTNFKRAKYEYEAAGYHLPRVVFWNVASRTVQQPVNIHESGTVLVSGCSPRVFSMLMRKQLDPYAYMLDVLTSERYAAISA